MSGPLVALAPAVLAALAGAVQEPEPRYELGWRTRALERAWMATGDESHAKALPLVESAVQKFFALDLPGVAAALDEARFALEMRGAPPALEALAITPRVRFVDLAATSLELSVAALYEADLDGAVALRATCGGVELAVEPATVPAPELGEARTVRLSLRHLAAQDGEFRVRVDLAGSNERIAVRELAFSRAHDLAARVAALGAAATGLVASAPALERATLRENAALLERLAASSVEETEYPAARLLEEAEAIAEQAARGERWFGLERAGQTWLSVPNAAESVRVRLFVPDGLVPDSSVPLVLALHGAGGSENMFFDAYGDGRIVELCRARGWMLAAPRVGFRGVPARSIVDALAERYPIDRARVHLIGHSMGAAVGQQLVAQAPAAFRSFTALGGGASIGSARALIGASIFAGAGERDFGRRGAEALHRSLVEAGSTSAKLRIYPHCEHLMVVADALPDVFAWLDGLGEAK
jgi:predicted esterase